MIAIFRKVAELMKSKVAIQPDEVVVYKDMRDNYRPYLIIFNGDVYRCREPKVLPNKLTDSDQPVEADTSDIEFVGKYGYVTDDGLLVYYNENHQYPIGTRLTVAPEFVLNSLRRKLAKSLTMMKAMKGSERPGHKYKSRKKVGDRYVYDYGERHEGKSSHKKDDNTPKSPEGEKGDIDSTHGTMKEYNGKHHTTYEPGKGHGFVIPHGLTDQEKETLRNGIQSFIHLNAAGGKSSKGTYADLASKIKKQYSTDNPKTKEVIRVFEKADELLDPAAAGIRAAKEDTRKAKEKDDSDPIKNQSQFVNAEMKRLKEKGIASPEFTTDTIKAKRDPNKKGKIDLFYHDWKGDKYVYLYSTEQSKTTKEAVQRYIDKYAPKEDDPGAAYRPKPGYKSVAEETDAAWEAANKKKEEKKISAADALNAIGIKKIIEDHASVEEAITYAMKKIGEHGDKKRKDNGWDYVSLPSKEKVAEIIKKNWMSMKKSITILPQELIKSLYQEERMLELMKGKKLPIGTVRDWHGHKFQKKSEGDWREVHSGAHENCQNAC